MDQTAMGIKTYIHAMSLLDDLPPEKEPLDWNTRMKIAAGAAKGLDYLHDKANPPVIYRDFKSSNILLDEGFHLKLSDFGIAKLGPTSFGVVFLELITGRKAIDSSKAHGEQNLVAWARPMFNDRRKLPKLADPKLQGRFPMRGLYQALAIASMCIQEQAASRPLIADVVTALSYLASQGYDPSDKGRSRGGGHDEAKAGRILAKTDESSGSGRRLELDSEKEDSPREIMSILNKGFDRERAVAEAKLWGENWREKRRQSNTNSANADG